ncbi:hypothetical protein IWT5_01196 [Secundilactobacillus silagincola]|uniref:S-layer protein n=1 Tax=Secundilactobacillus silagincola TaxID=1714681 RepID=A0A1Z5J1W7_9LACO|nr:hypothetical protein [Secundilactobacillus silagincola]GAX08045.1 hypothetical protein IWT5_01196 [Secundilactobacillus silagincola]
MQSSLKKSLYLGLAAVSFAAVAGATTANASAAATVTSNPALTAAASDRNVAFTGTNAIYTKPGTVKGAKVVASTTTLNKIKDSTKGQDNVRVYGQAVTNRGSVYYKVVTFDKAYRGWVYGGTVQQQFNGGIKSYTTTTDTTASLTTSDTDGYYNIAKPGTANDGTATTYTAPAWTQYKLGRTTTDGTKIGKDLLKVSKQATRTREGDTWVYVTDATNSQYSGWILKSALTKTSEVPASEGVTVNYVEQSTAKTVGSYVVPFKADNAALANQTMNLTADTPAALQAVKGAVPAGYSLVNGNNNGSDSFGDSAKAAVATKGSSVTYYVKANANANVNFVGATKDATTGLTSSLNFNNVTDPTSAMAKFTAASNALNGQGGLSVSSDTIKAALVAQGLGTIKVGNTTYTLDTVSPATYGGQSTIIYK